MLNHNFNPPLPPSNYEEAGRHEIRKCRFVSGYGWEKVDCRPGSFVPCQRSLHSAAVRGEGLYIFGGYDGTSRVNDFYEYHFPSMLWKVVPVRGPSPSPRDRHVSVVWNDNFYVFGGANRVNDFYSFCFQTYEWSTVPVAGGSPPSARHSHASVVHRNSFYVFGGYDGSYRNDFHEYNFQQRVWTPVLSVSGRVPKARYRATCCVRGELLYLFGGHDGTRHLNDVSVFDFSLQTWSTMATDGVPPLPRDSHVAVVHRDKMFIFGGSTGSAMDDFYELDLETCVWSPVTRPSPASLANGIARMHQDMSMIGGGELGGGMGFPIVGTAAAVEADGRPYSTLWRESLRDHTIERYREGRDWGDRGLALGEETHGRDGDSGVVILPGLRFCHVACVYQDAMYIFGGYDGSNRLNDFLRFRFASLYPENETPPSTLIEDLRRNVNSALLSDITFIVEGIPVHAHKIMCLRCTYFHAMLTGEMMESRAAEVTLPGVRHVVFLAVLEYLYTDEIEIPLDIAMELFQAADQFGVDRLKKMCESVIVNSISADNAASIFLAADLYHAKNLRERAIVFILNNFDEVSRTAAFEEMGRSNIDLVFEILKRR